MFDEVDWHTELNTKDIVCLVVPRKVLQELNDHKTDPRSDRRRKRSQKVLLKLEIFTMDEVLEVRTKVSLLIQSTHPTSDWLREHDYDLNDKDDRIVGATHYFKVQNPEFNVLFFSDDLGARLKAQSVGIQAKKPSDSLHLPEEPDSTQKELEQTKQELARLKNQQPKLSLGFVETGEVRQQIEFKIKFDEKPTTDSEINAIIEAQRLHLRYTGDVAPNISAEEAQKIFIVNGEVLPFQSEVDEYHSELEKYLQRIPAYFQELAIFRKYEAYTRTIVLSLGNTGSSPAQNIRLSIQLPNGITLAKAPEKPPIEPTAPEKPRSQKLIPSTMNYIQSNFTMDSLQSIRFSSVHAEPPLLSSFELSESNNIYQVNANLRKLSHFDQYEFLPLYITFDAPSKLPIGFEITYRIVADNIPTPVDGKLLIRLVSQT